MGLSLLAGCDNEKQQIFTEAEKDLEQGSYEYALDEFTTSVNNGVKPAVSYRGIGICQLRLGNYDDAITAFTSALGEEKVSKSMARDLYLYRATARLQAGYLDDAMADCQVLAQNYEMDADAWFLTGKVALEMDGYDEAASDFEQAYGEDSSYDRAIQIYETYLDKDMEADGTRYLEAVLSTEAKGAEDLCSRGRIYYYMGDYTNAQKFLDEVDAAAVYVNASTRFTDGFEFGYGAEIGISTQKLHARGPMGLLALTTTKYIIYGNGQIRQ